MKASSPELKKRIVELYYKEKLTYAQIRERLGTSDYTILKNLNAYRKAHPDKKVVKEESISKFRNRNRFLSSFSNYPFILDNQEWLNVEQYYQASKTNNPSEKKAIRREKYASVIKAKGQLVTIRSDWEEIKIEVMLKATRAKFEQNPQIAEKLINTHPFILREDNTWHDNFWGNCVCQKCKAISGQNLLGKILMKIRDELISNNK